MHPTVYCMRKAAHSLSRIPMRRNGVVAGEFHMVKRLFGRPAERNSIWSLPHRVSPFVASNRFATGSFLREEGVIGDLHVIDKSVVVSFVLTFLPSSIGE